MSTPLWVPFKDPMSRAYGTQLLVGMNPPRYKRIWTTRNPPLDQGQEGACTAFGSASRLAAAPDKWEVDNGWADHLFKVTVDIDKAEGRDYHGDGATMLASMKAGVKLGYYRSYYWCFGINDVIDCIVRQGPVLLGIPWYPSMSNPGTDGLIHLDTSGEPSGHCIMANGYWPKHPDFGDVLVLTNTWGSDWGLRGRGYISVSAVKILLSQQGEAVKPHEVTQQPSNQATNRVGSDG